MRVENLLLIVENVFPQIRLSSVQLQALRQTYNEKSIVWLLTSQYGDYWGIANSYCSLDASFLPFSLLLCTLQTCCLSFMHSVEIVLGLGWDRKKKKTRNVKYIRTVKGRKVWLSKWCYFQRRNMGRLWEIGWECGHVPVIQHVESAWIVWTDD